MTETGEIILVGTITAAAFFAALYYLGGIIGALRRRWAARQADLWVVQHVEALEAEVKRLDRQITNIRIRVYHTEDVCFPRGVPYSRSDPPTEILTSD